MHLRPLHRAQYPMLNRKAEEVGSFLTRTVLADPTLVERHFPLFRFAPKATVVLQPGDVLINTQVRRHL